MSDRATMSEESRVRVERATLRLVEMGGCGVLVPGEFILTATHCIAWSGTGGMALGDVSPTPIETASGAKFSVGVAACDPVSDMAVLEELDNQAWPDDADRFEEWREQVEPIALSSLRLESGQSLPVFIFTHKQEWIEGKVTRYGAPWVSAGSSVALTVEGVENGTSGSPVVTADGLLYGIVSQGSSLGSPVPVANQALPYWVLARIGVRAASKGN